MTEAARLLFPAIRWNAETETYEDHRPVIEEGLDLGVGGFILFGGTAESARSLTAELRERSRHPLLIGADLERGAGQQFLGGTSLPPPAALAALDDLNLTRRAGELTAREALAMGVNWIYAPVADLDLEPENPIVGSRAFGADPERASRHVAAWVEGCRSGGALSCAKHYPGHGRTTSDSHLGLPRVPAPAAELETDRAPFRAAIAAGVDAIMTAHVAYPALDPSGLPATLSRPILGALRAEDGFDGLVVTDALVMEGVLEAASGGEPAAAVRAVAAGCDAILYPGDPGGVAAALERARGGVLDEARFAEALGRIRSAAASLDARTRERATDREETRLWGRAGDAEWAVGVARRAIGSLRGEPRAAGSVELVTVDDDVGSPYPVVVPRTAFPEELRAAGVSVTEVDRPSGAAPVVVALYADIRGYKGRPGLSQSAIDRVASVITAPRGATVVLFGHPRSAAQTPGAHVLGAWGGEPLMQRAAARWLAGYSSSASSSPSSS